MDGIKKSYPIIAFLLLFLNIIPIVASSFETNFSFTTQYLFSSIYGLVPIIFLAVFFFRTKLKLCFTISLGISLLIRIINIIDFFSSYSSYFSPDYNYSHIPIITNTVFSVLFLCFYILFFADSISKHKMLKIVFVISIVRIAFSLYDLIVFIIRCISNIDKMVLPFTILTNNLAGMIISFAFFFYYLQLVKNKKLQSKASSLPDLSYSADSLEYELSELQTAFKNNQISESEYNTKKAEILSKL